MSRTSKSPSPNRLTGAQISYLWQLRRAAGLHLSHAQVADAMREAGSVKVSPRAVATWFGGKGGIRPENLKPLAAALGVPFAEFMAELNARADDQEQGSVQPRYNFPGGPTMAPLNLDVNVSSTAQLGPLRRLKVGGGRVRSAQLRIVMAGVIVVGRANRERAGEQDEENTPEREILQLPTFVFASVPVERVGAVEISGPYLEDAVSDGDFLFFEHGATPEQSDIVIVRVDATGELIAKGWWERPDGTVMLIANPASGYREEEAFDPETMTVLGVGLFSMRRPAVERLRVTAGPRLVAPPPRVRVSDRPPAALNGDWGREVASNE